MPRLSLYERQARRAKRGRTQVEQWVDDVLQMPCPSCGRLSLIIEDPTLRTALVIYCERSLCLWKPSIATHST